MKKVFHPLLGLTLAFAVMVSSVGVTFNHHSCRSKKTRNTSLILAAKSCCTADKPSCHLATHEEESPKGCCDFSSDYHQIKSPKWKKDAQKLTFPSSCTSIHPADHLRQHGLSFRAAAMRREKPPDRSPVPIIITQQVFRI